MKEEKQIKDWLSGSMSAEELADFKSSKTYSALMKIDDAASYFKAPSFNEAESLANINSTKSQKQFQTKKSFYVKFSAIAALLVAGLFIAFNWMNSSAVNITTAANQQESIILPDSSTVFLNANSSITYNKDKFLENRNLTLAGEAFFKVKEGSTFSVQTPNSLVEVLGTSFNIKSRNKFAEVDCYTGKVKVTDLQDNQAILTPLQRFYTYNGEHKLSSFGNKEPGWIGKHTSIFYKTQLKVVLEELSAQYQLEVDSRNINTTLFYTGSFVHDNLEEALQSITLPFQLDYTIQENQVTLQKD